LFNYIQRRRVSFKSDQVYLVFILQRISMVFKIVDLSVNINKNENFIFNPKSSGRNLFCGSMVILDVANLRWEGIHIYSTLPFLWLQVLRDVKEKLKIGYAEIIPYRGNIHTKLYLKSILIILSCFYLVNFRYGTKKACTKSILLIIEIENFCCTTNTFTWYTYYWNIWCYRKYSIVWAKNIQ